MMKYVDNSGKMDYYTHPLNYKLIKLEESIWSKFQVL